MKKREIEKRLLELESEAKELREKLEEKPKFEAGKWYKDNNNRGIIARCTKTTEGKGFIGYGLSAIGVWRDEALWLSDYEPFEATKEEVEEALIKEAKRRGFKEGVRFKSAYNSYEFVFESMGTWDECRTPYASLCAEPAGAIFCNGKWAEIISEPKVIINGQEMKQEGNIISFGCAKFYKEQLIKYKEFMYSETEGWSGSNRWPKELVLSSGVKLTADELCKIVDNIK